MRRRLPPPPPPPPHASGGVSPGNAFAAGGPPRQVLASAGHVSPAAAQDHVAPPAPARDRAPPPPPPGLPPQAAAVGGPASHPRPTPLPADDPDFRDWAASRRVQGSTLMWLLPPAAAPRSAAEITWELAGQADTSALHKYLGEAVGRPSDATALAAAAFGSDDSAELAAKQAIADIRALIVERAMHRCSAARSSRTSRPTTRGRPAGLPPSGAWSSSSPRSTRSGPPPSARPQRTCPRTVGSRCRRTAPTCCMAPHHRRRRRATTASQRAQRSAFIKRPPRSTRSSGRHASRCCSPSPSARSSCSTTRRATPCRTSTPSPPSSSAPRPGGRTSTRTVRARARSCPASQVSTVWRTPLSLGASRTGCTTPWGGSPPRPPRLPSTPSSCSCAAGTSTSALSSTSSAARRRCMRCSTRT
mmetsp:Transcript_51814/g.143486  ORF Transcript_51814/g.143486 Transcript_51814/m.143486 type:complete len:417 (+) Transcript_51814:1009-2259(+)